jgi:hypothetical protein
VGGRSTLPRPTNNSAISRPAFSASADWCTFGAHHPQKRAFAIAYLQELLSDAAVENACLEFKLQVPNKESKLMVARFCGPFIVPAT